MLNPFSMIFKYFAAPEIAIVRNIMMIKPTIETQTLSGVPLISFIFMPKISTAKLGRIYTTGSRASRVPRDAYANLVWASRVLMVPVGRGT
jgi:hypothetical protein